MVPDRLTPTMNGAGGRARGRGRGWGNSAGVTAAKLWHVGLAGALAVPGAASAVGYGAPSSGTMVDDLKIAGWGPPPTHLSLEPDEVHVWRGTVRASRAEAERMAGALSRRERREADRAEQPKAWVAARFMVRSLLGRYQDVEPSKVKLRDGADGRAALDGDAGGSPYWDFDWADSRALFAISASQPLAIHLEVVPEDLDVSALMAEMPPREASLAEFLSPQNRARTVVGHRAEREAVRRLGGEAAEARIERLRLGKRFVAALAARGWEWTPSFWQYEGGSDEPAAD